MTSKYSTIRVLKSDADALRLLAIRYGAKSDARLTITDAVHLVIETARPHLPELNDGGISQ